MEENNKLELKIIALKEGFKAKIASTTEEYEDKVADLRIELTEQDSNMKTLQEENSNLQGIISDLRHEINELKGETVVQEEEV